MSERPNRITAYFDRETEIRFDYPDAPASTAPTPTEKGAARFRVGVLLAVLFLALALLALSQTGCRAPDQAVLAADAGYYNTIGREYEANLDAGRIFALRTDLAGSMTLSAQILSDAQVERRKRALRSWRALVAEGRREEEER